MSVLLLCASTSSAEVANGKPSIARGALLAIVGAHFKTGHCMTRGDGTEERHHTGGADTIHRGYIEDPRSGEKVVVIYWVSLILNRRNLTPSI